MTKLLFFSRSYNLEKFWTDLIYKICCKLRLWLAVLAAAFLSLCEYFVGRSEAAMIDFDADTSKMLMLGLFGLGLLAIPISERQRDQAQQREREKMEEAVKSKLGSNYKGPKKK
eukprot:g61283.t1